MSTWEERMAAKNRVAFNEELAETLRRNGEEFTYEKAVQHAADYCSKCAEAQYEPHANRWQAFTTCGHGTTGCEFKCEHHNTEVWYA